VDQEDRISLDNWLQKYQLICASSLMISSFSMSFFTGFGLGSLVVPRFGDMYGRRRVLLLCLSILLVLNTVIACIPGVEEVPDSKGFASRTQSQKARVLSFILMAIQFPKGILTAGTSALGVCFICELTLSRFNTYLSALWNASEAMILIYLTTFYIYNKNTIYVQLFQLLLYVFCIVNLCRLPESPKWLLDKNRFGELRATL